MLRLLILAASMLAATVPAAADRYKDCSQSADQDRSIRGCTQILKRGKRESRKIRSIAYTNRGLAYARKGQAERAIADYDKAIKIVHAAGDQICKAEIGHDLYRARLAVPARHGP